jgi:hypothetical protein
MEVPMSLTIIRRLAAIAVTAVIPFGAAASSAHAATWNPDNAQVVTVTDDDAGVGFATFSANRSSWS